VAAVVGRGITDVKASFTALQSLFCGIWRLSCSLERLTSRLPCTKSPLPEVKGPKGVVTLRKAEKRALGVEFIASIQIESSMLFALDLSHVAQFIMADQAHIAIEEDTGSVVDGYRQLRRSKNSVFYLSCQMLLEAQCEKCVHLGQLFALVSLNFQPIKRQIACCPGSRSLPIDQGFFLILILFVSVHSVNNAPTTRRAMARNITVLLSRRCMAVIETNVPDSAPHCR
jgi:hypothetical protein